MTDKGFTTAEQLREEGRREILREIAKLNPMSTFGDIGRCNFCEPDWDHREDHMPACLFLRARQARHTQETP